jgi:PKD domain
VRVLERGRRPRASGLRRGTIRVTFGDGKRARGKTRARHRYPGSGSYRLVVKARDRAGNSVVLRRRVRVP